jgi:hypothetical protein
LGTELDGEELCVERQKLCDRLIKTQVEGFRRIREVSNKAKRVRLGRKLAKALNPDLLCLVDSLKGLNPEEQAAICAAKLSGNLTFPMLVARYLLGTSWPRFKA